MHCIRRLEDSLNSRSYANLFLQRDVATRVLSDRPLEIDYGAIARGLGARARVVRDLAGARDALRAALVDQIPNVIVISTDPTRFIDRHEVWRDVAPSDASTDPKVIAARERYLQERRERRRFRL